MSDHKIKPKRTTTSGIDGVPTTSNLEAGEIAINLADKKLFVRDTSSNILELTTRTINSLDDATISSPTTGEVLTYNAGLVGWENTAATSAEWVTTEHVVTTAGERSFSAAYTSGSLDVFLNGIRLDSSDYVAVSGVLIILDTGAAVGDTVYISSYTLTSGALPSQSGNSGKYLTTDGTTATWASVAADTNNYVDSLAFSTSTGVLTVGRSGSLGDLTVDLDGAYLSASSTSSQNVYIRNTSPTVHLRDTDHNTSFLHCNSSRFYVLGGATDAASWTAVNGEWPVYWDLTNNNMRSGGSITAAGAITAYSDERLKDNIKVIDNALDKVTQLRGITYNRNDIDTDRRFTGVIAQEVEKVLPEAIEVTTDNGALNGEGGATYADIKSVAYGNMVGLLIEAIKELKEEVDSLKGARDEQ